MTNTIDDNAVRAIAEQLASISVEISTDGKRLEVEAIKQVMSQLGNCDADTAYRTLQMASGTAAFRAYALDRITANFRNEMQRARGIKASEA
jgi:hypothetical protein